MDHGIRRRFYGGALMLLGIVLVGTFGYYAIGDGAWPLFDCFYMTVITMTTVGYNEVLPGLADVAYARAFTMGLLIVGMGVVIYFVSNVAAFIIEGDLRRVVTHTRMRQQLKRLRDHVIVCGVGSTGHHVVRELLAAGVSTVGIDSNEGVVDELRREFSGRSFYPLTGDATEDHVLDEAQIERARGLVCALAGDKDNLYLAVTARQANPSLRIVARCSELSTVAKLRKAGADTVVSPNFIGGMRMVSEMIQPAVVRFVDDLLRDDADVRIDEVAVPPGSELEGRTMREAALRERVGVSVLAVRHPDGESYEYNPSTTFALAAGMILVVLGRREDIARLRELAGSGTTT